MTNDLSKRVKRIYAALGDVEITNMKQFTPQLINNGKRIGFSQNFMGGLSDEGLANSINSLIHNIVSLRDNLKSWVARNSLDKRKVDDVFKNSESLKIMMDLWNNDKHGYPPRDAGYSGKSPQIINIHSEMQLSSGNKKGSSVMMTFNAQGKPQISGSGSGNVIITGDIVDKENKKIGDFHKIAVEAIEVWERLLADFGIDLQ